MRDQWEPASDFIKVKVTDPESPMYGMIGRILAFKGNGDNLVYFPVGSNGFTVLVSGSYLIPVKDTEDNKGGDINGAGTRN